MPSASSSQLSAALRLLPSVLLLLPLLLTAVGNAQNESLLNNVTVTVPQLPNVTPAARPEATLSFEWLGDKVVVRYSCFYYVNPGLCPTVVLNITTDNGASIACCLGIRLNTTSDCGNGICRYIAEIPAQTNASKLLINYELRYSDGVTRRYHIVLTRAGSGVIPYVLMLGVLVAFVLHGDPWAVAAGAAIVPLILYILASAGIIPLNFATINIAIIVAAALFFIIRKTENG